jgi:DNA-binding NtrC family response regulator
MAVEFDKQNAMRFSHSPSYGFGMVGTSQAIARIREVIRRLAVTDVRVLICGETGTGKELVARAIHQHSSRSARNLVSVNCASIPDALFESELFGYERGAFTGAAHGNSGLLRDANGGTLFLDEIGEMSALGQAKVLRAIEEGEIRPLGAQRPVKVNFRLVAATHRDLDGLVLKNGFRPDLFFRLNVVRIYLPPLRDRREDIPDLIRHFLDEFNSCSLGKIVGVSPEAMRFLCDQEWPGNIRQLRNAVEAAFALCEREITVDDVIPFHRGTPESVVVKGPLSSRFSAELTYLRSGDLLSALKTTRWNKTKAAELLQCSRMTVYRKMRTYGLCPDASDHMIELFGHREPEALTGRSHQ